MGKGLFGDLDVGQLFVGWGDLVVDFVFELMFIATPLSARRYRLNSQNDKVDSVEVYRRTRDCNHEVNRRIRR